MKDNLLIVGIDPGLTVGYAFLGMDGRVVEIGSAKQFSLSDLVSLVINHGQPIAVGCDKKVAPSFVQRFSAKFNARLLWPRQDMLVEEKKQATAGYDYGNAHEMDALASALFAYRHLEAQIRRVERFVEQNSKQAFRTALLKKVIRNEYLSVSAAMESLEQKKIPDAPRQRAAERREFTQQDYLVLMEKHRRLQIENAMMRELNEKLEREIDSLKSGGMIRVVQKVDGRAKIEQQKGNVAVLRNVLERNRQEAEALKRRINSLTRLLSLGNSAVILKRLRNLSYEELQAKKAILNIGERDILLVDDPNAISERAVAQLKGLVSIILTKKQVSSKLKDELGFIFINAGSDLLETEHFAAIDRKEFDKKLKEVNLIKEIIESYKKERVVDNG